MTEQRSSSWEREYVSDRTGPARRLCNGKRWKLNWAKGIANASSALSFSPCSDVLMLYLPCAMLPTFLTWGFSPLYSRYLLLFPPACRSSR